MSHEQNLFPGKSRQYIVIFIITGLFIFLLFSLSNFITAFLGALIFYVLFRKFMNTLIYKYHWKKWLAATLIILISFLVIVVPTFGLIYVLFSKVQSILANPTDVALGYHTLIDKLNEAAGREIITNNTLVEFSKSIANQVPGILNSALDLFGSMLMLYFLLYNLLVNTGDIERNIFRYLPFSKHGIDILTKELRSMTYANAIAVPAIALCQGIIASVGFYIFGLTDPLFWGIMCGCASVIPIIGGGLIWIPAGIYLLSTGENWQGIGLLAYSGLIISTVDNLLRFLFAKWFADVHPIITILGVIIGLKWFGLPGLVFGPLVISYFFLLLKIYKEEFITSEE
ncbi:MAG: AI-2E family transporter [Bacteroidota bacterium]